MISNGWVGTSSGNGGSFVRPGIFVGESRGQLDGEDQVLVKIDAGLSGGYICGTSNVTIYNSKKLDVTWYEHGDM